MSIKRVYSANLETSQIDDLELLSIAKGYDNTQLCIRQAVRSYIAREMPTVSKSELQKAKLVLHIRRKEQSVKL